MPDDYLKRYTRFGWDYEIINPISHKIRNWYINQARQSGEPVLELACGSGRLLLLLAEAGLECIGLDICDEMLDIARQRIDTASSEVRNRVDLYKSDITNFKLDQKFGTVIIADNSLRDLKNIEQQQACIERAYAHLCSGGVLLVTLRRLEPEGLASGRRETGWSKAIVHPETRMKYQRKAIMHLSDNNKKASGFILYRAVGASDDEVIACPFEFPVISTDEYADLFRAVGFSVEIHTGYEYGKTDNRDTIVNFVCRCSI
jgi:ubiquinone/menaquinone biosynthesis C-methylase UbiE